MKFFIGMVEEDHFARWDAAGPELRRRVVEDFEAFTKALRERGTILAGEALAHPDTARTVARGPTRASTQGPFAETVEQLGGFYHIEVPTYDDAVEIAGLLPREYSIEVRETLGVVTADPEAGGTLPRFLLLIAVEPGHWPRWAAASTAEQERAFADFRAFARVVAERGAILGGDALADPMTARTVRPGLPRTSTQGPYAETVEQLAGFYVIAAPDQDTAVRLAGLLPREYAVEVREAVDVELS